MEKIKVKFVLLSQLETGYRSWYSDVTARFEARADTAARAAQISQLRRSKDSERTDVSLIAYRDAKSELQESWFDFYENELVLITEKAVSSARRPDVDLYIVVMPEFQIHDYEPNVLKKVRINHYSNPLYEDTLRSFIDIPLLRTKRKRERQSGGIPTKTFINFTKENQDIVVFAGSVWWKQWKAEYPKGLIFNSAVVFYQGACCFMWDKQNLSSIDGLDTVHNNAYSQWFVGRYEMMRAEHFPVETIVIPNPMTDSEMKKFGNDMYEATEQYLIKNHRGILSDLTKQFNPLCTSVMAIEITGKGIVQFSLDICLDAKCCPSVKAMPLSRLFQDFEITHTTKDSKNPGAFISHKVRGEKADIQIVIAAGMRNPHSYTKQLLCLCDALWPCRVCRAGTTGSDFPLNNVENEGFLTSDVIDVDIKEI